jgi:hypothetical protein
LVPSSLDLFASDIDVIPREDERDGSKRFAAPPLEENGVGAPLNNG